MTAFGKARKQTSKAAPLAYNNIVPPVDLLTRQIFSPTACLSGQVLGKKADHLQHELAPGFIDAMVFL
jgi:hypothetical protein